MMVVSVITLIISLLIQGLISNYVGYIFSDLTIFYTFYLLIALGIILPYFQNQKKYFILLVIFGFLIDIVYTNTFVLNVFIFIIVYFFNKLFYVILPYNLITINIGSIISIIIYHILSFIILFVVGYDTYSISMLLTAISHSIIMTILYASCLYLILDYIHKKFELREVR